MPGALQPPATRLDDEDLSKPDLAARLIRQAVAVVDETGDPATPPLLAPPLYGRWHMGRAMAALEGTTWFDELNLDPRLADRDRRERADDRADARFRERIAGRSRGAASPGHGQDASE